MDTEEGADPSFFGTWKPATGFEPGISPNEEGLATYSFFAPPQYGGYRNRMNYQKQSPTTGLRYRRNQNNGRWFNQTSSSSRETYWGNTGPKLEIRKMLGSTLELPIVAPASAPPEDKKLILTQTSEKIAEAASGDWQAKTQQLAQRFVVSVPNSVNEAKVRLAKLKDFTSTTFDYGPTIGLHADLSPADLNNNVLLRYLSFEVRVKPRNAPPNTSPIPDLPEEFTIQAVLKIPLNALQTDIHHLCTIERLHHQAPHSISFSTNSCASKTNRPYSFFTLPRTSHLRAPAVLGSVSCVDQLLSTRGYCTNFLVDPSLQSYG